MNDTFENPAPFITGASARLLQFETHERKKGMYVAFRVCFFLTSRRRPSIVRPFVPLARPHTVGLSALFLACPHSSSSSNAVLVQKLSVIAYSSRWRQKLLQLKKPEGIHIAISTTESNTYLINTFAIYWKIKYYSSPLCQISYLVWQRNCPVIQEILRS